MKYCVTLLLLLGVWADDYKPREKEYGNVGQLRNYGGIYTPRYDYENDGEEYGQAGQIIGRGQGQSQLNIGASLVGSAAGSLVGSGGSGGSGLVGSGGSGLGGSGGSSLVGSGGSSLVGSGGAGLLASGNLGLSAGLGLQAGLAAGGAFAGNFGGAIGIGINANLNVNLDARLGLTNEEDIVRPCNVDDWQCIRKFFATNSQCSPSYGPVPDPLYLDQSTLYVPYANLNMLMTNVRITGMGSAKIRDFYVNRITGNLVISLDIQNLSETSPRTYARYQRLGRESINMVDFSAFAFAQLSLTAVIPNMPNLRLDMAEIHADYQDEAPKYEFGPSITNSTNSLVLSANAQLSANLQAVIRESFLFQSQLLAAVYIQQNICDFGVKLSSY